jgi:hypothetical protein
MPENPEDKKKKRVKKIKKPHEFKIISATPENPIVVKFD